MTVPPARFELATNRLGEKDGQAQTTSGQALNRRVSAAGRRETARTNAANRNPVAICVKRCGRCKQTKDVAEFSPRRAASDGLQGFCKECFREIGRTERGRARRRESLKKFRQTDLGKQRDVERRAADTASGRVYARSVLNRRLITGEVVRGPCYALGDDCYGRMEAHHDDYSRPLDVVWTCKVHHVALDAARRDVGAPLPRPRHAAGAA